MCEHHQGSKGLDPACSTSVLSLKKEILGAITGLLTALMHLVRKETII